MTSKFHHFQTSSTVTQARLPFHGHHGKCIGMYSTVCLNNKTFPMFLLAKALSDFHNFLQKY